ncbi:MAG TPA: efflux RND transporter periplasmic adaptor subunit [Patescibacteria group bacterium]|nr:efflux RND transporter periplasmic adaptor subunit [Patescibacteria group bacterium]
MLKTFFQKIASHKFITLILIAVIAGAGYYYQKNSGSTAVTRYVLAQVEKGTLITSISGTGQISASSQVEIKAQASGEVISLPVKAGQEVKSGALLAQLDSSDAYKSVRDAKTALETAQLELEEALEPASELTLLQAESSLLQAKQTKTTAEKNLVKSYEDGFNTVSSAFLELPSIISGLRDILYSNSYTQTQNNMDYYADSAKYFDDKILTYRDDAKAAYEKARLAYDDNFSVYKTTNRTSDEATVESLINQTYETVRLISESVKSTNNLIQFYQDKFTSRGLTPQSLAATQLSSLSSYSSKTNTHLSSLLTAKNNIPDYKEDITDAERTIKEKELSLTEVKADTDELTIRAKKIAIQQKQDALASAQETLADYSVRAPFNGVIADVSAKKGDTLSSGSTVAMIITKDSIAEITLNEVDVAKVKVGQKANLTFDALEDLTIAGSVAEVDTIGTASSGVVSYTVQISFDTQDERIKPGMSVTAVIILEAKTDVLLVPSAAVKSAGEDSYVELVANDGSFDVTAAESTGVTLVTAPTKQTVTVGSSDDTNTEIVSGVVAGDLVITRTINASTTQKTTANSTTNASGNAVRVQGFSAGGPPGGF